MGLIFKYDFRVRIWPLAYIPYGGMDFGEILAVVRAIDEGDDDASALPETVSRPRRMRSGGSARERCF
jgi:hypothetical protein